MYHLRGKVEDLENPGKTTLQDEEKKNSRKQQDWQRGVIFGLIKLITTSRTQLASFEWKRGYFCDVERGDGWEKFLVESWKANVGAYGSSANIKVSGPVWQWGGSGSPARVEDSGGTGKTFWCVAQKLYPGHINVRMPNSAII